MTVEITMLVASVYPGPWGGAVFFGKDQAGKRVRAVADRAHLDRPPRRGETWRLRGTVARHAQFGDQLHVESAKPVKPDGRVISHYLSHHPAFRGIGIGPAKVARLLKTFGERLIGLLDEGDAGKLGVVLDGDCASSLIQRWRETAAEASLVAFLDAHGADVRLAAKVLRYWPDNPVDKLRANPYRLLFLAGWSAVDRIASSLSVGWDDDRRLAAAAESVIYGRLHAEKDTLLDATVLQNGILQLLGAGDVSVARRAIELAVAEGILVGGESAGYQAFGSAVMEKFLAAKFHGLLSSQVPEPDQHVAVYEEIQLFERAHGIRLNAEQRSAVQMAMWRRLSVVKGGAGVGKTTVLKAICALVEARHGRVVPMALAGRAAQRIREATGRDAFTITAVLNQIKRGMLALGDDDLVVIDEASMLDLILVYRLMRALPQRPRLLLVGDPFQLPPIGPGLVFHVLAESGSVPQQELTQVHRQAAGSHIPAIAHDIRHGRMPPLHSFAGPAPGLTFVEAPSRRVTSAVIEILQALADCGEAQILGVTKRGDGGVEALNAALHDLVAAGRPSVPGWGFAETEPVIHLVNDYDRELFNGSLGRIRRVLSERSEGGAFSHAVECVFDGVVHRFPEDSLDRLALAHAITVHKAQGSQFQRVIVPVVWSRLLDRTLIYTALTRAVEQVVFVGDGDALRRAVQAPPHSARRRVGFRL